MRSIVEGRASALEPHLPRGSYAIRIDVWYKAHNPD